MRVLIKPKNYNCILRQYNQKAHTSNWSKHVG